METGIKVGDAMTLDPVIVKGDSNIKEAVKLMNSKKVGSLLIKEGNAVKGIFTERNVIKAIAKDLDISKTKISEVMDSPVHSVSPDLDIFEAMKAMAKKNIRRLAVVNEGRLVGMITMKDMLRIEPELIDLIADKLEVREADRKLANLNDQ